MIYIFFRDSYSGMPVGGIPVFDVINREDGPPVTLDSLRESYVRINKITERCHVNGCEKRIKDCPIYEKIGCCRLTQLNRTKNDGSKAQTRVSLNNTSVACLLHKRKYSYSIN